MAQVGVFKLNGGREVQIISIRQYFTYGGLIEGLPTDRTNRRRVENLMKEERDRGSWVGEPYLVPPPVKKSRTKENTHLASQKRFLP